MLNDQQLHDIARQLTSVPGVAAVLLGGSRARGHHTPESDFDLGLYYRPPLDVAALGALARQLAGPKTEVTEPGAWGPWVDGGGWLSIDGTSVDWIYRDLDRAHASWQDAREGRFDLHHQVGHPLGVPDFAYAGEVALGVILSDPTGELTALQQQVADYPPALGEALVAGLWEAGFCLDIGGKAVSRADAAYVAGCLFRTVEVCAHALHGHAGRWLVNEKGAITSAGDLSGAPADFATRSQAVLAHLGTEPEHLREAIAAASDLLTDVSAACVSSPRRSHG